MITSAAIEMIPAQLDFGHRLRRDRLQRYRQTRSLRELCALSMLIFKQPQDSLDCVRELSSS